MSAGPSVAAGSRTRIAGRPRSPLPDTWTLIGLVAFFGLLVFALFGERIAPHEPIYFVVDHGSDPRPYDPGLVFPLGSDVLGRDLFSLILAGARTTLSIVLLAGAARVAAGVLVAAVGSWWRPAQVAIEYVSELVSAVPATIFALVLVKIFVKAETTPLVFIGALLVIGWAGPYRVIRQEIDRLAHAPFTQGANAMGVGRWRLFWRHHLPHLVPVIAINLSQQVVASLVLVAELGVLGTFVGTTRTINIEESLRVVRLTEQNSALIADPPEWGGLLAAARTIESLWTTRWLIFVPGLAFGITAIAIAALGYALARRYARRDITNDLRGRGAAALGIGVVALFVTSALVPERYASARDWATAARAEVRPTTDIEAAFSEAELRPIGASYAVERDASVVAPSGPAKVSVAGTTMQASGKSSDPGYLHVRSFASALTGGGTVEAPLVFAGRGISQADYPEQPGLPQFFGRLPDLGALLNDYDDDYSRIDVRGKVVLLVRFQGICAAVRCDPPFSGFVNGPPVEDSIANAIKRGAAAVIFVDPSLWLYTDGVESTTYGYGGFVGGVNPYRRVEVERPPTIAGGVPVMVLSGQGARDLLAPIGLDVTPQTRTDARFDQSAKHSVARDLGVTARVEVPLARNSASVTSYVAEVPVVPADAGRILVWNIRRASSPGTDVVAALGRSLAPRRVPFIFVDFDPSLDPALNAKAIRDVLQDRHIELVIVLDRLTGPALRFITPHGDLIPAFDLYSEKAGARFRRTSATAPNAALADIAPFIDLKTVIVTGSSGEGELSVDSAALLGYLAGRVALGAEELPR